MSRVPVMSTEQPASEAPKALDHAYAAERARLLEVFGKRLRAERERRNVSLEGLAVLANVHRTHLGALELREARPAPHDVADPRGRAGGRAGHLARRSGRTDGAQGPNAFQGRAIPDLMSLVGNRGGCPSSICR